MSNLTHEKNDGYAFEKLWVYASVSWLLEIIMSKAKLAMI